MALPRIAAVVALVLAGAQPALAQDEQGPAPKPTDERVKQLEDDNEELQERLEILEEELEATNEQVKSLLPVKGKITGYLDFGFFATTGDGAGTRREIDFENVLFPEFDGIGPPGWVFLGDPLSTAVNSRGEPADTGESRAVVFDSVDSQGHPSFILNAVNLALFAGLGENLQVNALVDFVPRSRDISNPDGLFLGDYLDVKLAYAEYRAPIDTDLSVYAGKFDSVLGFEYRSQEAPDRLTVTPSLICRYICGHPLGLKARVTTWDGKLSANVSVTNGSHFWEGFDFADEIDSNPAPTAAGRLSVILPVGEGLELGVSGAYGPQDAQATNGVRQWHVGGDLHLAWRDLELFGEYVKGRAEGDPASAGFDGVDDCSDAPCLEYQGAYGLLGYRVNNYLIPYFRTDWRDALHRDGMSFVYISELLRVTPGIRLEIGAHVIIKAEYTVNTELGRIPEFPNDVFTSALIIRY